MALARISSRRCLSRAIFGHLAAGHLQALKRLKDVKRECEDDLGSSAEGRWCARSDGAALAPGRCAALMVGLPGAAGRAIW